MISKAPPRWLERMLLRLLPERDRETISGDLLEEYREEQLPRTGPLRANFWYLRQAISFIAIPLPGVQTMNEMLIPFCVFGIVAGTWLGVMENILKHDGYAGRTVVAACIALQALITLLPLGRLSGLAIPGAIAIIWLGYSSISRMLIAPHFEGFVLIIGASLILQGGLTLAIAARQYYPERP